MISSIIIKVFLALLACVLVIVLFFVVLWLIKRVQDRESYEEVLGIPEVETLYKPADYARAAKAKRKKEKQTEQQ